MTSRRVDGIFFVRYILHEVVDVALSTCCTFSHHQNKWPVCATRCHHSCLEERLHQSTCTKKLSTNQCGSSAAGRNVVDESERASVVAVTVTETMSPSSSSSSLVGGGRGGRGRGEAVEVAVGVVMAMAVGASMGVAKPQAGGETVAGGGGWSWGWRLGRAQGRRGKPQAGGETVADGGGWSRVGMALKAASGWGGNGWWR